MMFEALAAVKSDRTLLSHHIGRLTIPQSSLHRFTKGIVRNDQLRCFGATILRIRVLEGSGQENFAGMRFESIGKRLIAFFRCREKDIEDHQPCASSHQLFGQGRIHFARPGKAGMHQLERARFSNLLRAYLAEAERALIDCHQRKFLRQGVCVVVRSSQS